MNPPPSSPRSQDIFKALKLLQPYDTRSFAKLRVGPEHDGGYIMFDDLEKITAAYSFGIGNQVGFDTQLADIGKQVYMFDHTIPDVPSPHPNFHFFRQGIAGIDNTVQSVFTLQSYIDRNGHIGCNDLILKIDVEGAEYDALISTPVDTLRQFRQFVLELHWLSSLNEIEFRSKFIAVLEKINTVFSLCHVHANNCAPVMVVDGFIVADVLELSYIRSDIIQTQPSKTVYPCEIDHANAWWNPDHLLWFYPFLPMSLGNEDLAQTSMIASLAASEQTTRAYRVRLQRERILELQAELALLEQEQSL